MVMAMTLYYSSKVFRSVDPEFINELSKWYRSRRETLKIPIFNHSEFDLAKLWHAVRDHGGSEKVCQMKRWAAIGRLFNPPPSMTNLSFHMKRLWSKYLLDYEREMFSSGAMLTEDSSPLRQPCRRASGNLSDASPKAQRKRQKPNGCEEPAVGILVGQPCHALETPEHNVGMEASMSVADIAASLQLRKPASLNDSGAGLGAGPQTCLLGSSSLHCEASQQLQQDIQSCNSIWVVLPNSPGVQNFAIAGETTELAVGNADQPAGGNQRSSHVPIVRSPVMKDESAVANLAQRLVAANHELSLHSQQQEPPTVEASPMGAEAAGQVQFMSIEEWCKQRIGELCTEHTQDIKKMKDKIDDLQQRIQELEGNLSSLGSIADEARWSFNTLLQIVKPNTGVASSMTKLLALSSQQQQPPPTSRPDLNGHTKTEREPSTPPNSG